MNALEHLTDLTRLPLSFNQRQLWIISQQDKSNPAYNILLAYHLEGEVDFEILRKSIEILFTRQHTMFSVFNFDENGYPFLNIIPCEIHIDFLDFSALNEISGRNEILSFGGDQSRIPFDLESGPLFRLFLTKENANSYFFFGVIHHIIFDGYSRSLFVQELSEIYNKLLAGLDEHEEPLRFHSYDFAAREAESDMTNNEKAQTEFWKENLKGCKGLMKFPYDYPREKISSGYGCREYFNISGELSNKLRAISKESGISLFNVLLPAIGLLFNKYSGEEDICIGVPLLTRRSYPSFKIFGLFVNTLPVRLIINRDKKFKECIDNSAEVLKSVIQNSQLPFGKIVETLKPERIFGVNPYFQITLSWINNFTNSLSLGGVTGKRITVEKGISPFDMTFYMWENNDIIEGEIEYSVDLLKRETIVHLKNCFIQLLKVVAENPEQNISDISIIPDNDRKILAEFNNTDTAYENDICIHQIFERQVVKNPDLPALLFNDQTLNYRELNEHANRMAGFLISKGVGIEDTVAICYDRSAEMYISILGILKAGAAYLPINPGNPQERLISILDEAKPKIVLSGRLSSVNMPSNMTFVSVDDIISNPLSENIFNPNVNVKSDNLAYVLYTSGSTGKPKGVMIEHHSVINRLKWMQKAYPLEKSDTLLQKTPITFDVSVWELFWWFFNGASLVLLSRGGEKVPDEIVRYIDKYKITAIHFVPSMFASFVETVNAKGLFNKLSVLKRIFLSGEALPAKLVNEFNAQKKFNLLPDLINLYGPTEATVDVSYYNCPDDNVENIFIGRPIDNTKLFVVNENNEIQPIGIPGELLISGVNLARGYLNQPDLTAEKFFDFKTSEGTIRAYRTGDLVKMSLNSEIEYIGRLDNQVKIRGYRIELGEVEAKIREHPFINNCAVIAEDNGDFKYLIAYVSIKTGEEITAENLKTYLGGKLPDYMVPSYIAFLNEFPLTGSGKLDRKRLPKIDKVLQKKEVSLPTDNIEKKLLDLWKVTLKVENISTTDNFFDIGGNSILAINLANKISKEFGIIVKVLLIFEYPSIKDQSNYLSKQRLNGNNSQDYDIDERSQRQKNVNFKRHKN